MKQKIYNTMAPSSEDLAYIMRHYLSLEYLTEQEIKDLETFSKVSNYNNKKEKLVNDAKNSPLLEQKIKKLKDIIDVSDDDIEKYNEEYYNTYRLNTAKRILNELGAKIFINRCPICGKIARTPQSKQGPCGHKWYEYHLVEDKSGKKMWIK